VDLSATFNEEAQHAALAELVQKSGERDTAIGRGGQADDLGGSDAALPGGRKEGV
jgi:hypothetical protein